MKKTILLLLVLISAQSVLAAPLNSDVNGVLPLSNSDQQVQTIQALSSLDEADVPALNEFFSMPTSINMTEDQLAVLQGKLGVMKAIIKDKDDEVKLLKAQLEAIEAQTPNIKPSLKEAALEQKLKALQAKFDAQIAQLKKENTLLLKKVARSKATLSKKLPIKKTSVKLKSLKKK